MPPINHRALEKTLADIKRLVEQQEFENPAELEAYMANPMMTDSGNIMELLSEAAAADTPLDQAQDLMYQAWDATGRKRVSLARKALALSPDCADAYVLLAEETAKSVEQAIDLYEQGLQAGERALGAKAMQEYEGNFWGILETRPYMRARQGLAMTLWDAGRYSEAIEHCAEMLRLNPSDNQGIRFVLASYLLQADEDDALSALLERYEDDPTADLKYARALCMFRQGDSAQARASLQEALRTNPFVPPYLLGRKRIPLDIPPFVQFGQENEAQSYAAEAATAWFNTPGALDWLREGLSES